MKKRVPQTKENEGSVECGYPFLWGCKWMDIFSENNLNSMKHLVYHLTAFSLPRKLQETGG